MFTFWLGSSPHLHKKSKMNEWWLWGKTLLILMHMENEFLCLTYAWLWVTQSSWSWWGWWPPRGYRRRWSIHWCAQSHHQPINQHRMGYYEWHLHSQDIKLSQRWSYWFSNHLHPYLLHIPATKWPLDRICVNYLY